MAENKRKKIAVIGSGMCALTAVYHITKTPDWRQKYDITIYQQGWRIGGKGASGRNLKVAKRIEEHGLHIWFGFYTNAFNMIKDCYAHLPSSPSPLKTWKDAFKPQSYIPLEEFIDGKWETWGLDFPTNDLEPGGDTEFLPLWQYIKMTLEVIRRQIRSLDKTKLVSNKSNEKSNSLLDKLGGIGDFIEKGVDFATDKFWDLLIREGDELFARAIKIIDDGGENIKNPDHASHKNLLNQLDGIWQWLKNKLANLVSHYDHLRHLFIIIDLGLTTIKGILRDDLLRRGLNAINNEEYRHWLRRHGAADLTINSTLVTALYDVGFAYEHGDIAQPSYEAGSAIRIIIRLGLTYKGAFMWKMQAGMGDTIFTPIYEVLSQYKSSEEQGGINFKFFHKVKNLRLSADKKSIAHIEVEVQAHPKDQERGYQPLVPVKDLPCWPSEPLYEQLREGEELQARKINLESFWTPWKGEDIVLEKDKDFDLVILGTPIATLPHLCPELIDANPKWMDMIQNVKTTQTQAYQLWLKKDLKELGWEAPSPVMTSYVEPVDTWADMSQLIIREDFPAEQEPKNIAYFCGVFKDAEVIPPPSVHSFPAEEHERVKKGFLDYLNNATGFLWPKAVSPTNPKGLDFNLLVDLNNQSGEQRVNSQFWRANIDPSERYTLTNVNSSIYRLRTDETGFSNLYITGDWIQNNFNYGCIEACVMSGMMTARALTGYPFRIIGENSF